MDVSPLAQPLLAQLHVDGVPHGLGDAAVLHQREAFPGTLPWSLEIVGPAADRLQAVVGDAGLEPGMRPRAALAARLLTELRVFLLRAGTGRARFSLSTIERVEIHPRTVRFLGTCAPIMPGAAQPVSRAV